GTAGEQSCEGVVAGAAVDQVVGFVDDDGVPVRAVQVMCVDVALERVHGDDRALEIGEGVATSGDVLLNTLDSGGVQTDERDGEASPQLTLELLQHMRGGDDEDALAAAAPDEFREQDADLEGLPKADHVRDQDAWLRVLHGQRQLGGAELMDLVIHEEAVG